MNADIDTKDSRMINLSKTILTVPLLICLLTGNTVAQQEMVSPVIKPAVKPVAQPVTEPGSRFFVDSGIGSPTCQGTPRLGCQAECCQSTSGAGCQASFFDQGCHDHFGRYWRVFGGWNWLDSAGIELEDLPAAEFDFKQGGGIGTALGKYITPQVRRELEFSFRRNSVAESDGDQPGDEVSVGSLRNYAIMGNLVREWRGSNRFRLNPYVGAGLGISFLEGDMVPAEQDYSISDTAFAYQAFAGVDRQIRARTKVFCEYRYFGTSRYEITSPAGVDTDRYSGHNIFFGLQFHR
jgi:opacity protein-like surface antigen